MPKLRAGEYVTDEHEIHSTLKDPAVKAEDKEGHKPLSAYNLPKWVYHPEKASDRIVVKKQEYYGMAVDGLSNYNLWNVAHVAAYHDNLKLLSLATPEQCREPNKYGMTPAHMCAMGIHPYGPSLAVLYELVQLGAASPQAKNHADQTPWHVCQRMHKKANLAKFEKVLLKGGKPDHYDELKETQLRLRGKFARPAGLRDMPAALEDLDAPLPTCLLFPGQGSQYGGMLEEAKETPAVKELIQKANEILGYDIMEVVKSEEMLGQTKYCQPAMYLANMAALEQLKEDDLDRVSRCSAIAGLSLGEYTALTAAGVWDFETGMRLVKVRGEAMDREAVRPGREQSMLSVAGLAEDILQGLCDQVLSNKPDQVCQIANYLFPKGFTVSGTKEALQELEEKAMAAGALQAKVLRTAGAFHTSLMAGAKEELTKTLAEIQGQMRPPRCKVYMNVTAAPIGPETSVEEIVSMLGEQLVSPVRWEQSMARAIEDGCTDFYELGPGKQLKAMMKRINKGISERMTNVGV